MLHDSNKLIVYRTDLQLPYLNTVTSSPDIQDYAVYSGIANIRDRNALRIIFYDVSRLFPFAIFRLSIPMLIDNSDKNVASIVQPAVISDVMKFV